MRHLVDAQTIGMGGNIAVILILMLTKMTAARPVPNNRVDEINAGRNQISGEHRSILKQAPATACRHPREKFRDTNPPPSPLSPLWRSQFLVLSFILDCGSCARVHASSPANCRTFGFLSAFQLSFHYLVQTSSASEYVHRPFLGRSVAEIRMGAMTKCGERQILLGLTNPSGPSTGSSGCGGSRLCGSVGIQRGRHGVELVRERRRLLFGSCRM